MPNWEEKIPPIRGNLAIINKTEDPDKVLFEDLGDGKGSEKGLNGVGKGTEKGRKGVRKRRKGYPDRRLKFSPNKHVRSVLDGLKAKYGAKHVSYFINRAIELYATKTEAEVE